MPTPRTIAIAGGTGFIGAEVLRHVARAHPDDHVIALAHSDASLDRLQDDGFRAVRADMTQPGTWQEHLIGADVIIQADGCWVWSRV